MDYVTTWQIEVQPGKLFRGSTRFRQRARGVWAPGDQLPDEVKRYLNGYGIVSADLLRAHIQQQQQTETGSFIEDDTPEKLVVVLEVPSVRFSPLLSRPNPCPMEQQDVIFNYRELLQYWGAGPLNKGPYASWASLIQQIRDRTESRARLSLITKDDHIIRPDDECTPDVRQPHGFILETQGEYLFTQMQGVRRKRIKDPWWFGHCTTGELTSWLFDLSLEAMEIYE